MGLELLEKVEASLIILHGTTIEVTVLKDLAQWWAIDCGLCPYL